MWKARSECHSSLTHTWTCLLRLRLFFNLITWSWKMKDKESKATKYFRNSKYSWGSGLQVRHCFPVWGFPAELNEKSVCFLTWCALTFTTVGNGIHQVLNFSLLFLLQWKQHLLFCFALLCSVLIELIELFSFIYSRKKPKPRTESPKVHVPRRKSKYSFIWCKLRGINTGRYQENCRSAIWKIMFLLRRDNISHNAYSQRL